MPQISIQDPQVPTRGAWLTSLSLTFVTLLACYALALSGEGYRLAVKQTLLRVALEDLTRPVDDIYTSGEFKEVLSSQDRNVKKYLEIAILLEEQKPEEAIRKMKAKDFPKSSLGEQLFIELQPDHNFETARKLSRDALFVASLPKLSTGITTSYRLAIKIAPLLLSRELPSLMAKVRTGKEVTVQEIKG